ncbi:MAG TPA: MauE/DoxX family redox-associated membrane protein, partial [Kofleriaceae bacterium]|nr:MauE/DoxX family redox-associated membrane protein [Kofleriaceae bacterium]
YVLLYFRTAVAMVLAIAVIAKLGGRDAFHQFTTSLDSFGLPARASVAAMVITSEAASAVLLAVAPHLGGLLAAVLLVGFAIGIAGVIRRGETVHCRCFGATTAALGHGDVIRNLILAAASAAVALGPVPASLDDPAVVAAIALGLAVGAAIAKWDDLTSVFAPVQRSSR